MNAGKKILIVEDEEQLLRMLRSTMTQAGYEVDTARSGSGAINKLATETFGAVLLDLGLPDMDGKEVIDEAKLFSSAPILIISARGSEKEKIAALDMGASDYLAKPFHTGELLARIRVAMRTHAPRNAEEPATARPTPKLKIDFDRQMAFAGDRCLRLSVKETTLLRLLSEANGKTVTNQELSDAIWGPGADADAMKLRVLTWQVRKKIEPEEPPRFVITVTGVGYRLMCE